MVEVPHGNFTFVLSYLDVLKELKFLADILAAKFLATCLNKLCNEVDHIVGASQEPVLGPVKLYVHPTVTLLADLASIPWLDFFCVKSFTEAIVKIFSERAITPELFVFLEENRVFTDAVVGALHDKVIRYVLPDILLLFLSQPGHLLICRHIDEAFD